jgi:predicted Ser/Thr protein kinase
VAKYRVKTETGMIKERQKRNVSKGAKDKVYMLRTAAAAIKIANAEVSRTVVLSDSNVLTRNWVRVFV